MLNIDIKNSRHLYGEKADASFPDARLFQTEVIRGVGRTCYHRLKLSSGVFRWRFLGNFLLLIDFYYLCVLFLCEHFQHYSDTAISGVVGNLPFPPHWLMFYSTPPFVMLVACDEEIEILNEGIEPTILSFTVNHCATTPRRSQGTLTIYTHIYLVIYCSKVINIIT